jgi:hypothetical protein
MRVPRMIQASRLGLRARPLRTTSRSPGRDCQLRPRERSPAPCSRSRSQPRLDEARALVRGRPTRAVARTGKLAPLLLGRVVHVIGCGGEPATMRRAVTHQAPATTRRPPLPSSASAGHGDTEMHGPEAHRLRARSSPARRSASRCRGGAGRWAIRWAKPCRIGPYQAQRRALTCATVWSNLQVFRGLGAPLTPCFTRERTLVRNQPRPSEKWPLAGTLWQPRPRAPPGRRPLGADSPRFGRAAPTLSESVERRFV